MHIWYSDEWKKYVHCWTNIGISGLRLRFDKQVDPTVRRFCIKFSKWLRNEFEFPIRLTVYVKKNYRIKAKDGDMVVGTCWKPFEYSDYPYIRLATGDYQELVIERGKEQAMWSILATFVHELTHYYQFVNNIELTPVGEERQASAYVKRILAAYDDYLHETMNHK